MEEEEISSIKDFSVNIISPTKDYFINKFSLQYNKVNGTDVENHENILNRNKTRGSEIHYHFAEAFVVLRIISE